jgi:DNA-binding beta-propeller fold protein YncE
LKKGEHRVKSLFAIVVLAALSLNGCGSSGSSSSFTSGSTFETSFNSVSTLAGSAGVSGSVDASGSAARFNQPDGVAVSQDGSKLFVADFQNGTIRQIVIATQVVTTIAGSAGASGNVNGTGSAARFSGPQNLATDGTNLFVTDFNNNEIRKIDLGTGAVTTLAGSGASGSADGIGPAATFSGPSGITISQDLATLFVTDFNGNHIRKIDIASAAVTTLATNAALLNPSGIATDGTNLYITQFNASLVSTVSLATGAVSTLAGSTNHFGTADGVGAAASFEGPNGMVLLGGNLYLVDSRTYLVRKIVIASGTVTTVAGTPGVTGSADGTGSAASFSSPIGIAQDGTRLFIADSANNTIRVIQ